MQTLVNTFNFFKNFQSSVMLTASYLVDASGSKTVNKNKVLSKFNTINIGIGQSYEKKVQRKLENMIKAEAIKTLAEQGNDNPDLVQVQAEIDRIKAEKEQFKAERIEWSMRIPNTRNMFIPKKVVADNWKELDIEQLNKLCLELPIEVIAENALLQCITESSALETKYFYTNPETLETTEVPYNELEIGVHVTPSFFKEKSTVGRGSVDKENDFKIFTVYLKNLVDYTHSGNKVILK